MLLSAVSGTLLNVTAAPLPATSPLLAASASYSVLGGETVTNTGATTLPGNLGVSPGSAVTGFPPGIVGPPGEIHAADQSAADAQADNTAAFIALDQGCTTTYGGTQDLTAVSPLGPGVYCAPAFSLSGNLTLSGTVGVWIFKSGADLNTSVDSSVTASDPCNVWWRLVSSATLLPGTVFLGNILADTSITLQTGASLNGRAFARTGQVALDNNTITGTTCLGPPAATSTPTSTNTPTETPTVTETPTPTVTSTAPPQNTAVPASTNTPLPPPPATATVTAPAVVGLPATGGGPLPAEGFPWSQALVLGGLGALAVGLWGVYRRGRGLGR